MVWHQGGGPFDRPRFSVQTDGAVNVTASAKALSSHHGLWITEKIDHPETVVAGAKSITHNAGVRLFSPQITNVKGSNFHLIPSKKRTVHIALCGGARLGNLSL